MSYYDVPKGSPERELGRAIYMNALAGRRGFRDDQLGIEDEDIWAEIFEAIGAEALRAASWPKGCQPPNRTRSATTGERK